jgi:hypothetical protein
MLDQQADIVTSAVYREEAQDALASPEVTPEWKEAISDRLNEANHKLEMRTVTGGDSY